MRRNVAKMHVSGWRSLVCRPAPKLYRAAVTYRMSRIRGQRSCLGSPDLIDNQLAKVLNAMQRDGRYTFQSNQWHVLVWSSRKTFYCRAIRSRSRPRAGFPRCSERNPPPRRLRATSKTTHWATYFEIYDWQTRNYLDLVIKLCNWCTPIRTIGTYHKVLAMNGSKKL